MKQGSRMKQRQMSFQQYRNLDLFLFCIMLAVSETLIVVAGRKWFPGQLYTASVTAAVTAIVMMRWNGWAGIHAMAGGLIFCLAGGGTGRQFLIYMIGNEAALGALLLLRLCGKNRIREEKLMTLLFALSVQLLMQLGRGAVALVFGASVKTCWNFFTTDALSDVFTMVIVWIASRLDGVLEDQKSYLLRVHEQMEREKGGF